MGLIEQKDLSPGSDPSKVSLMSKGLTEVSLSGSKGGMANKERTNYILRMNSPRISLCEKKTICHSLAFFKGLKYLLSLFQRMLAHKYGKL